jgi:aminoglycoside phosphotransferase
MVTLPADLAALVEGSTWEQVTLGKSGAQVYRLRAGVETRYLKIEPRRPHGDPRAEAKRLRWLRSRLPVPALRYAGVDERQSYLLTVEVPGTDATDERWLNDPGRLVAFLAESLRLIHRQPSPAAPSTSASTPSWPAPRPMSPPAPSTPTTSTRSAQAAPRLAPRRAARHPPG